MRKLLAAALVAGTLSTGLGALLAAAPAQAATCTATGGVNVPVNGGGGSVNVGLACTFSTGLSYREPDPTDPDLPNGPVNWNTTALVLSLSDPDDNRPEIFKDKPGRPPLPVAALAASTIIEGDEFPWFPKRPGVPAIDYASNTAAVAIGGCVYQPDFNPRGGGLPPFGPVSPGQY